MTVFPRRNTLLLTLVAALIAPALASCGGNDDDQASRATPAEGAFLEAMVPHHESAVAMAMLAKRRAEHPRVSELGEAIIYAQEKEIAQMKDVHKRLFGQPLLANEDAHSQLGLSAEQAGMMHGMEAASTLKEEKPFDRAFIDEMVPHHQGAIRMARAVLAKSEDEEIQRLAKRIASSQSGEIRAMNRWRKIWYGTTSPSGGVPNGGSGPVMDGGEMEHEGH